MSNVFGSEGWLGFQGLGLGVCPCFLVSHFRRLGQPTRPTAAEKQSELLEQKLERRSLLKHASSRHELLNMCFKSICGEFPKIRGIWGSL